MNKKIIEGIYLSFDDVLLKPQKTEYSLDDIDLSVQLTKKIKLKIPIIASPMDTVCDYDMVVAIGRLGGLGIIHRNQTIENQALSVKRAKDSGVITGAAVGLSDDSDQRVSALVDAGVDIICIDHAIGYSQKAMDSAVKIIKEHNIDVISANIATTEAINDYVDNGINIFRFGTGAGSICISRQISGVGIPQFSALLNASSDLVTKDNIHIIADGGIKTSGDIVKALAAGAMSVMVGSIISATKESPGDIKVVNDKKFKQYRGMGSKLAMESGSSDRYNQQYKDKFFAEGVVKELEYKGVVGDIVEELIYGIKTGLIKSGAKNIQELHDKAEFIRIAR